MDSYFLIHHGITGQKWGVRNGPPYPLEQKSNIFNKSLDSIENKVLESGRNVCDKIIAGGTALKDFSDYYRIKNNYSKSKSIFDLLTETIQIDNNQKELSFNSTIVPKSTEKRESWINDNNLKKINPGYNTSLEADSGCVNNCIASSVVCELYLNGYRNLSAGLSKYGCNIFDLEKYFPGSRVESINRITDDIDNILKRKYGNNSSGCYVGAFTLNNNGNICRIGSHAIHWSIDNKGILNVTDGQTGKRYNGILEACNLLNFDRNYKSNIIKLSGYMPDIKLLSINKMIAPNYDSVNGIDMKSSYKSLDGNTHSTFSDARNQSKTNLYNEYRQFKRNFYNI